jgi:hypothetical protein
MPPAPSQRDEPVRAHKVDEVGELVIPADQLRNGLPVCTENPIRVDGVTESPKLAE